MNELEYRKFYDRVGQLNGWDFSKIKGVSEGVLWSFYEEVSRRLNKSDLLLDIGTGGGEAILSIADDALLIVGIDQSAGMVDAANKNVEQSGKSNVRIAQMDADRIDFPDCFFNVISCRHSPFDAREVYRALAVGGIFLTQQVSEADKLNLKQAFGRGQSYGTTDGTMRDQYLGELREAGFHDIQTYEYDAADYFETHEDLMFLLKHTPIITSFGDYAEDFAILQAFIEGNRTSKGIVTNSRRFMITATK